MIKKLLSLRRHLKNSSASRDLEYLIKIAGEATGYPTTFSTGSLNPLVIQSITSMLQKIMLDSLDSIATRLKINERDFEHLNDIEVKNFINNKAQEISHSNIIGKGDKEVSFYDLYLALKIKQEEALSIDEKKYPKPIDVDSPETASTGPLRLDIPEQEQVETVKDFDQSSSEMVIKKLLNLYIDQKKDSFGQELAAVIDNIKKKKGLYKSRIDQWADEGDSWKKDIRNRGSKGYSDEPETPKDSYRDIIEKDPITLIVSIIDSMSKNKRLVSELKPYLNEVIFNLISDDSKDIKNLNKFLDLFKNAKWANKEREELNNKSYIHLIEDKINKLKNNI